MTVPLRSPFLLFRFALRERDWPLAALLAGRLSRSRGGRDQLQLELAAARGAGAPAPTLLGLRVLARLIRFYARSPQGRD